MNLLRIGQALCILAIVMMTVVIYAGFDTRTWPLIPLGFVVICACAYSIVSFEELRIRRVARMHREHIERIAAETAHEQEEAQ